MTPMPPLGNTKEPTFQARRDGAFRIFVRLFVFAQAPKKRAPCSIFLPIKRSQTTEKFQAPSQKTKIAEKIYRHRFDSLQSCFF